MTSSTDAIMTQSERAVIGMAPREPTFLPDTLQMTLHYLFKPHAGVVPMATSTN
jgi:hypothetical protein